MKYHFAIVWSLVFATLCFTSCQGQTEPKTADTKTAIADPDAQISEYVVGTFEDSKGNLWFGTISDGAARYDGKTLTYFSEKEGMAGSTVADIAEDQQGNIWFATHTGLSKFDGKTFTNYTTIDGLCNDRVSCLFIDIDGTIWIGTWEGVCRFNGLAFSSFQLPVPEQQAPAYVATKDWVTAIMKDRNGQIWISRSGYGVCKYDGVNITQLTKKDGLPSDCVQRIMEDRQGNIWFGCRVPERDHPESGKRMGDGGLAMFDGKKMIQFPDNEGLHHNDVYTVFEDKTGDIWIGATGLGAYRYDGKKFSLYKETNRPDLTQNFGLQSMMEDKNGILWFGFSGGLFRFNGMSFYHVTKGGPWK